MILPGAIALITPVLVGFGFKGVFADTSSPEILGGLLAGVTVSGVLMGIFQSNAGGAWDNAKKSFEKGVMIDGVKHKKGSEPHKAAVTGDTVGDPFKDTSGPSMNILIKLMSIVSLVIAPYIAVDSSTTKAMAGMNVEAMTPQLASELPVSEGIKNLGAKLDKALSSGVTLNIPENGIENNLLKFIENKDQAIDKKAWFDFDRLTFETGKSTLKPESTEQLKNIAEILKVFPNVNVKLGGYTDNTGDANANLKLSGERASTVKSELINLGIPDARLESEGYGQENPIATNDTEEGRSANRRISIRVTKK